MKRYLFGSLVCAVLACVFVGADSPASPPAAKPVVAVDLFDAMKSGDIEVKLILKDSTGGNVTIANKTDKPLTIKLPEAFAGVPALAQFGGGGMGGGGMMGGGMGGMGGGGMGGGNQGFGGGMGGGMMGGMGGGMGGGGMMGGGGGGFFNVAPEKVGKLKVVGVCLEHGKKDPNTRVVYHLKPIETLTKDPQVIEVVKMVGSGEIRQHAGQAAAWHLANGLSWKQLAKKIGVKHLNGTTKPYFTRSELDLALRVTQVAGHRAECQQSESPEATSPGEAIESQTTTSAE